MSAAAFRRGTSRGAVLIYCCANEVSGSRLIARAAYRGLDAGKLRTHTHRHLRQEPTARFAETLPQVLPLAPQLKPMRVPVHRT